jgi:hypothetical protein
VPHDDAIENGTTVMQQHRALTPLAHAELEMRASTLTRTKHTAEAKALLEEGRVEPIGSEDANTWEVVGRSSNTVYKISRNTCRCRTTKDDNDQYACAHLLAVWLYKRILEELRKGDHAMFEDDAEATLPLGPTTAEERLAQVPESTTQEQAQEASESSLETTNVSEMMSDEGRAGLQNYDAIGSEKTGMPLPAVLQPSPTPLPTAVLQDPLSPAVLEHSLQAWGRQRDIITRFLRERLVEDVDYGKVHFVSKDKCKELSAYKPCTVPGHWSKPVLFKPGAEKFTGLFQLTPVFHYDRETWEMLGSPHGVLCYVCVLQTRSGEIVGEGRGARDIRKDGGDVNKAIKMAEKASHIDAVLRTGALSDFLTQDLDDDETKDRDTGKPAADTTRTTPPPHAGTTKPTATALREQIKELAEQQERNLEYLWAAAERRFQCARTDLTVEQLEQMVKGLSARGATA